jgi:hypothetical protein
VGSRTCVVANATCQNKSLRVFGDWKLCAASTVSVKVRIAACCFMNLPSSFWASDSNFSSQAVSNWSRNSTSLEQVVWMSASAVSDSSAMRFGHVSVRADIRQPGRGNGFGHEVQRWAERTTRCTSNRISRSRYRQLWSRGLCCTSVLTGFVAFIGRRHDLHHSRAWRSAGLHRRQWFTHRERLG